jgi:hypothetical protein
MEYPHTIEIKEIPVPPEMIQVTIETDLGSYKTNKRFFSTREEFLEFWKPLVTYYEGINNDKNASAKSV